MLSNGTDNIWPFPCRISKLKPLIKVPPWKALVTANCTQKAKTYTQFFCHLVHVSPLITKSPKL